MNQHLSDQKRSRPFFMRTEEHSPCTKSPRFDQRFPYTPHMVLHYRVQSTYIPPWPCCVSNQHSTFPLGNTTLGTELGVVLHPCQRSPLAASVPVADASAAFCRGGYPQTLCACASPQRVKKWSNAAPSRLPRSTTRLVHRLGAVIKLVIGTESCKSLPSYTYCVQSTSRQSLHGQRPLHLPKAESSLSPWNPSQGSRPQHSDRLWTSSAGLVGTPSLPST
jgi:hypothetical protein